MADPGAPLDPRITEGVVQANGVDVHYLEAGSGPLALLLHGFPDSAHTWRHLLPALADAGYHAVAPWLRGYAPTSVPADGRYQVGVLAQDVCALHDALGDGSPAVLIGHDWGALAGYTAAGSQPERWSSFTALAVPPLGSLLAGFTSYTQLRRSWYMFFFQSPLADGAVAADDLAFIDRLWADWSPGFDAAAELPGGEGRAAGAREPHRRARLLPRHARRRLQGPGARRHRGRRIPARPRPHPVPARHRRRLHGCRARHRPLRPAARSRAHASSWCRAPATSSSSRTRPR